MGSSEGHKGDKRSPGQRKDRAVSHSMLGSSQACSQNRAGHQGTAGSAVACGGTWPWRALWRRPRGVA